MQIIIGLMLLIACVGIIALDRPRAGQDSVVWLSKPSTLGQAYVLIGLIVALIGVGLIVNGWPN